MFISVANSFMGSKSNHKKFVVHWNFQWRPSWKYAN